MATPGLFVEAAIVDPEGSKSRAYPHGLKRGAFVPPSRQTKETETLPGRTEGGDRTGTLLGLLAGY